MKVTIIVPVYGVEKYIRECAESLFRQTYEDIEYIFCDDSTPDGSIRVLREVMAKYPQRSVRIIHNETNKGIGGTRLHLLDEVKTDYFMMVDSDDLLPHNAVKILVGRMKETDADIIDAGYAEYANGKSGEDKMPCHDSGRKYLNKVLCNNLVSLRIWGKLYKTSVRERVTDLFYEGIDFAEDVCATTRLAAVTTRAWTDEVVYYYRTDNASSYTQNISEKNILSYFRACGKILSFYHRRGHLPFALEIGLLNAYRECRRSGISIKKADEIIRYVPQHMRAQLVFGILRSSSIPTIIGDYIYRFFRATAI